MVFQSYALWPHMTVLGNVGYGLRLRGVPRAEVRARVGALLRMLNLAGLEERKVTNLSGGQRQRVALGRALAIEPPLLLLDEPLSNLDAKVRVQLRHEIKALQSRLGFTAIHVTHDREEAMTMADRIVVMEAGRIAQVGAPKEVYERPASPFVASFMGADNTIALDVARTASGVEIRPGGGEPPIAWSEPAPVGPVTAYFRDDVAKLVAPDAPAEDAIVLRGRIGQRSYPGGHYRYGVAVDGRHFTVTDSRYLDLDARSACACRWRPCTCSQAPTIREEAMRNRIIAAAPRGLPRRRPGRGADAQRRDRRRPEHGRLHQGLSRPDVREDASGREGGRGRHRAGGCRARRRSSRSSTRRGRAAPRNPTSTWS